MDTYVPRRMPVEYFQMSTETNFKELYENYEKSGKGTRIEAIKSWYSIIGDLKLKRVLHIFYLKNLANKKSNQKSFKEQLNLATCALKLSWNILHQLNLQYVASIRGAF